ncbi:hypothetical protein Dsin_014985 [Dipteronia sinensis]|uniref:Sulfotransferase n=1 Tax=Dipteronia sinensis TaxID=43782 RepID=A0AAE0ANM8_9ROSI|nr:hypothetical protein Dsin_014985 [Dipteronia sinensis]
MFIETRTRIDKDSKKIVIDKEAAQVISQFEEHLCHIPEKEQNDIVREHVFTQVMGLDDHGRVRLYGTRTSSNVAQYSTVDEMRVELDELRSNYKDLQSKYEKLKSIVMSHYETCPQAQSHSEHYSNFLTDIITASSASLLTNHHEEEEVDLDQLPKELFWGNTDIYNWKGFWCFPHMIQSILSIQSHFKPRSDDIILASFPKTGTAWLKALCVSILECKSNGDDGGDDQTDELSKKNPHSSVLTIENELYG